MKRNKRGKCGKRHEQAALKGFDKYRIAFSVVKLIS